MRCWPTSPSASASSSGFTARAPIRASAARASSASSRGVPCVDPLHEREGQVAVDLDEEPPVDRLLRVADRERQELLLERLERPLAEVDLHRQARRARDQLLVGRAADDAPEEAIGLVALPLREQQLGELEVHDEEPIVLRDGRAELGDRVLDVLRGRYISPSRRWPSASSGFSSTARAAYLMASSSW